MFKCIGSFSYKCIISLKLNGYYYIYICIYYLKRKSNLHVFDSFTYKLISKHLSYLEFCFQFYVDFILQVLSLAQYSDFKKDNYSSPRWDNLAKLNKGKFWKG